MNDQGISVTFQQAQAIINTYHQGSDERNTILSFSELENQGYSHTPTIKSYLISLSISAYILLASAPAPDPCPALHPLPLPTVQSILALIHKNASVPVPVPQALDISLASFPFQYLLLSIPQTTDAPVQPLSRAALTPKQEALIDLRLGSYLQSLHSLQNDWFGLPLPDGSTPADPACYSWQDTFTALFEELLSEVEGLEGLPGEDIRRYLSRAFGSFLFDDAEVPCLIWLTGSQEDVFVSVTSGETGAEIDIAYVLPTFSRALWGDPLLEAFFMPPGPSTALREGYSEAGGGPLIVFPRQRTKRMWYTLFLALIVLADEKRAGETEGIRGKAVWAREILPKCVEALKDAPCY